MRMHGLGLMISKIQVYFISFLKLSSSSTRRKGGNLNLC